MSGSRQHGPAAGGAVEQRGDQGLARSRGREARGGLRRRVRAPPRDPGAHAGGAPPQSARRGPGGPGRAGRGPGGARARAQGAGRARRAERGGLRSKADLVEGPRRGSATERIGGARPGRGGPARPRGRGFRPRGGGARRARRRRGLRPGRRPGAAPDRLQVSARPRGADPRRHLQLPPQDARRAPRERHRGGGLRAAPVRGASPGRGDGRPRGGVDRPLRARESVRAPDVDLRRAARAWPEPNSG